MSTSAVSVFSFRRKLRRFRRNRHGSVVVEFAIIAPIFFGLIFAIIESALIFFAGETLDTIVQDSARVIKTGQAQTAGGVAACQITGNPTPQACTQATFKNLVCSKIPALFDCNKLYVDVVSYPPFVSGQSSTGFGAVTLPSHIDAAGNFDPTMHFEPGSKDYVVVVRLFYQWPQFVTRLGFDITNLNGGKRLLVATAAFKNEPF